MANPTANIFAGIDNTSRPEDLGKEWLSRDKPPVHLRTAVNIDITNTGRIVGREGFSLVQSGSWHSIWSDGSVVLGVKNGVLSSVDSTLTTVTSIGTVGEKPLAFCKADNGSVYLSNGHTIWRYANGTLTALSYFGSYTRSRVEFDAAAEETYYDAPPPGVILEWAFGRLWVVDSIAIYYSRPFHPERFDAENDFIPWADVTMLKFVSTGAYLGTADSVHFLPGGNPVKWAEGIRKVSQSGAVLGASLVCDGSYFDKPGDYCVWESPKMGKMAGDASGTVVALNSRATYDATERGAILLQRAPGLDKIISTFPKNSDGGNFGATDVAVAEVRRNGVVI